MAKVDNTMYSNDEMLPILLEQMMEVLRKLQENLPSGERSQMTWRFMKSMFALGLRLVQEPALQTLDAVTHFVQASAQLLPGVTGALNGYVYSLEDRFYDEWVDEQRQWQWLCQGRSAVEFLFEVYSNSTFEHFFSFLDTSTVDELMKAKIDRGVYVAAASIPAGIPRSHWWWYPQDVPLSE
jgi:hypothetical protein